jgi:membrane-bound lytic murein transglycosylase D
MPYVKLPLLTINLLLACLFSACQTLPKGERGAALPKQAVTPTETQAQEIQPTEETAQLIIEQQTDVTEDLQTVVENLVEPDLISRMVGGFSLSFPKHQRRVEQELNWYRSHPNYIKRIQERAEPYLHFILEEIDKRDIPSEIALLPAVESAFRPFAYSPGRAAGMWQFIPSTGRHFGLKQNWWYDGRRDVVSSTEAALDFLKRLNKQFNGDWELALAAYNSGAGTVRNAIRRNQKKGKPTDFWSLKLPTETSAYVPRLLALSEVFRHPNQHGVTLLNLPDEPYFTMIDIGSQLDLALAADMAGLPIQDFYLLNSGFNRWATDPEGPHRLNIPLDKADAFIAKLEQLPPEKRVTWKRYKIKPGDSLSVIARHNNTTVKLLRQVNKLRGNNIRAGRHLLIPVSSQSLNHYVYSTEQRKATIQNRQRKGKKQHYVVKAGDSLWDIARHYKINYKSLAKWNGMAPGDPLKTGQRLVIWSSKKVSASGSPLDLQPSGTQSSLHYKVRRGDSLSRIAQRFNVSVSDLKRWNTLRGKYLQPGQQLKLYVDVTEQTL